jgi:hypothetical protein
MIESSKDDRVTFVHVKADVRTVTQDPNRLKKLVHTDDDAEYLEDLLEYFRHTPQEGSVTEGWGEADSEGEGSAGTDWRKEGLGCEDDEDLCGETTRTTLHKFPAVLRKPRSDLTIILPGEEQSNKRECENG